MGESKLVNTPQRMMIEGAKRTSIAPSLDAIVNICGSITLDTAHDEAGEIAVQVLL